MSGFKVTILFCILFTTSNYSVLSAHPITNQSNSTSNIPIDVPVELNTYFNYSLYFDTNNTYQIFKLRGDSNASFNIRIENFENSSFPFIITWKYENPDNEYKYTSALNVSLAPNSIFNHSLIMSSKVKSNYDVFLSSDLFIGLNLTDQSITKNSISGTYGIVQIVMFSQGINDFSGNGPFFGSTFGIENGLLVWGAILSIPIVFFIYDFIKRKKGVS